MKCAWGSCTEPATYRVRWLRDRDTPEYDYANYCSVHTEIAQNNGAAACDKLQHPHGQTQT